MRRAVRLIELILVVAVLAGGVAVYLKEGNDRADREVGMTDAALTQLFADQPKIDAALTLPSLNAIGNGPTLKIDDLTPVVSQILHAQAQLDSLVEADREAVQHARDAISVDFLTRPREASLDRALRRDDQALAALGDAAAGQRAISKLYVVIDGFSSGSAQYRAAAITFLDRDTADADARLKDARGQLSSSLLAAMDPSVPPELGQALKLSQAFGEAQTLYASRIAPGQPWDDALVAFVEDGVMAVRFDGRTIDRTLRQTLTSAAADFDRQVTAAHHG